ncbi:MAG: glycerate kinase [Armatimonadota bacterium]
MRVVIAPDSFKGSMTSIEAADAAACGVLRAVPDAVLDIIPLADGGEGTVDAMVRATGGRFVHLQATGPLGNRIESFFGILGDGTTAVVEMAAASGLSLVPDDKRNPMLTTSFGTGELIRAALDSGCGRLILGIGGSATNDGGIGMAQALGGRFKDAECNEVGFGGGELARIRNIDLSALDQRLRNTDIIVACDVDNPLTGDQGASAVFGPQKGADTDMVKVLDSGLSNLADVIRRDIGIDVEHIPGAGAAGGMGAASVAFLGGTLKSGIDIVMDATHFADRIEGADLVITGEGRIDAQTIHGKAIRGVMRVAESKRVPVIAFAGGIENDGYGLSEFGSIALFSIINKPMQVQDAISNSRELLSKAVEQAMKSYAFGRRLYY